MKKTYTNKMPDDIKAKVWSLCKSNIYGHWAHIVHSQLLKYRLENTLQRLTIGLFRG